MSLLLDALKAAEGQAQRRPDDAARSSDVNGVAAEEEPLKVDTLTDHQILALAEDAPQPATRPGPASRMGHMSTSPDAPGVAAAPTATPSPAPTYRHNPAAFPPLPDDAGSMLPGKQGRRRWLVPAALGLLLLVSGTAFWVLWRAADSSSQFTPLAPEAQAFTVEETPLPADPAEAPLSADTSSHAEPAGINSDSGTVLAPVAIDARAPVAASSASDTLESSAAETVRDSQDGAIPAQAPDAISAADEDPILVTQSARAPLVITGRPSPLTAAHAALRAGDLPRAEQLYRETLATERDQADAHLGMALIEQSRGAVAAALAQYRAVLAIRPGDAQAWAGLADLTSDGELEAMESRLRTLLAARPDPALHFALGNILARQARWSQAQESYFAAATGAPQNADYAFNLAVALDRLGKGSAALPHYQRALVLAGDARAVQFDSTSARARVLQLEAARP